MFCTGSGPKNGRRLIDMKIHPFYNESKWMQPTPASPEKEEVICMRSITVQRLAEFTEQDYEFTFGITRKEFAQSIDEFPGTYSACENNSMCGSEKIAKLALCFGVSTDYLYGLTDELTPPTLPEGQSDDRRMDARQHYSGGAGRVCGLCGSG